MSLASGVEIGGRAGAGVEGDGFRVVAGPMGRELTPPVGPLQCRGELWCGTQVSGKCGHVCFSPCIWEAKTTQPALWGGAFSG